MEEKINRGNRGICSGANGDSFKAAAKTLNLVKAVTLNIREAGYTSSRFIIFGPSTHRPITYWAYKMLSSLPLDLTDGTDDLFVYARANTGNNSSFILKTTDESRAPIPHLHATSARPVLHTKPALTGKRDTQRVNPPARHSLAQPVPTTKPSIPRHTDVDKREPFISKKAILIRWSIFIKYERGN